MTSEDFDAAKKLGKEWRDNLLMMHELRCEVQAARIQLKPVEGFLMQEIEALAAKYKGSIHLLMSEMRAEIRQKAIEQNYAKAMTPPPGVVEMFCSAEGLKAPCLFLRRPGSSFWAVRRANPDYS